MHFVAFDVDAKVFDPVKKLGATVVGAADEKQLNTQLEYILQRKILLEEEEGQRRNSSVEALKRKECEHSCIDHVNGR